MTKLLRAVSESNDLEKINKLADDMDQLFIKQIYMSSVGSNMLGDRSESLAVLNAEKFLKEVQEEEAKRGVKRKEFKSKTNYNTIKQAT